MAGFRISADITIGDADAAAAADPEPVSAIPAAVEPPGEPRVLELRVHGVNNTTPAALLDVPADSVTLASGDQLGSFWTSTAVAAEGKHGHVPEGIVREAYSWGGMVRTTPQFGGSGTAGRIAAVGARIFYALILPFSIGNAVIWARRITQPGDSSGRKVWIAITAGIARLFGLILTLLFTTTLVTLAIDIGALQCAADPDRCEPLKSVFEPMAGWSPGQRVALLALVPVAASRSCGSSAPYRGCGTTCCRAWRTTSKWPVRPTPSMLPPTPQTPPRRPRSRIHRRRPCSPCPGSGRTG